MDQYARPQQLVRVNQRRRLNLLVMGDGGPTVVLAAGYLGGTLDWGLVQPYVARSVRVVSFDSRRLRVSRAPPGREVFGVTVIGSRHERVADVSHERLADANEPCGHHERVTRATCHERGFADDL